jgi:hypothetical protein
LKGEARVTRSSFGHPERVERLPNAVRRRRHVDVIDAERPQRVKNGADDRRRRAGFARSETRSGKSSARGMA